MHYEVELLRPEETTSLSEVQVAVLTVLDSSPTPTAQVEAVVNKEPKEEDAIAIRSVQAALKALHEKHQLVDRSGDKSGGYLWTRATDQKS